MKKEMEELTQKNTGVEGWFMPEEERAIFERAINRLPHPSIFSNLSHNELNQYSKIYLAKHNFYHREVQENLVSIAEIKISLKTLLDLLNEDDLTKVVESYLHLALLSIEENQNSIYVISGKVLICEFVEIVGLEPWVWNWKAKTDLFPLVLNFLKEKSERNNLDRLVERYQNLRIQEILPPLHL